MLQTDTRPVPDVTNAARAKVLLVDDDRMALMMIQSEVEGLGFEVSTAANGAEAYALVREDPARFDLIMTDRMMPIMDGLALTRRLKRDGDTSRIPIILLTGASEANDVSAGLEAGAFYYLTKPPEAGLVKSVLESALKEVRRQKKVSGQLGVHQSAFRNVEVLRMVLSRPEEVEPVCSLLSSVHDQPDKIVQGIFELVQNGIEHGVLGFGLTEKARLLDEGAWEQALAARSRDPIYAQGRVEATMVRRSDALILTVKDTGKGFDWRKFISADPSRSSLKCGRGIARARTFIFDKIAYNDAGNEVRAAVREVEKTKW